jgi:hypothetical protein
VIEPHRIVAHRIVSLVLRMPATFAASLQSTAVINAANALAEINGAKTDPTIIPGQMPPDMLSIPVASSRSLPELARRLQLLLANNRHRISPPPF